jgi:hypothetical protein
MRLRRRKTEADISETEAGIDERGRRRQMEEHALVDAETQRRLDREAAARARPAATPEQRYVTSRSLLDRDRSAAQRASSMIGGPQSEAFGSSARQAAALGMAGLPVYDYTGMTELARAGAGASAAAETEAGRRRRMLLGEQ